MEMSVREARSNFAHALDLAEKGESVTITRNGKPVAELRPPIPAKKGFDWERAERWRKEHGIDTVASPTGEAAWLEEQTDAVANRALLGIGDDWRPDLG